MTAFVRFIWEFDGIMRLSLSTQIQVGDNLSPYLNEGC